MKPSQILLLLPLFLFAVTTISYAQIRGFYLGMSIGPNAGFTSNLPIDNSNDGLVKVGMGYSGQVGIGYASKRNPFFLEGGIGYYRFRQSVDATELQVYLPANAFSFSERFLQLVLKIGYRIPVSRTRMTVSPFAGCRVLFHLPARKKFKSTSTSNVQWEYQDVNLFVYSDVTYARYYETLNSAPIWAYILQGGLRFDYQLAQRLSLNTSFFMDLGLRTLRGTAYHSEIVYDHAFPPVDNYTTTAINKGDAVGMQIGASIRLKR